MTLRCVPPLILSNTGTFLLFKSPGGSTSSLLVGPTDPWEVGPIDLLPSVREGYRTDAFLGDIVLLIFGAMVNDKIHSSRYHWPIVLLYSSGWILR